MDLSLFLASAVASFFATVLFVPWLIRNLRGTTLVGKDLNKPDRPTVPEMGGVGVMLGFCVGVAVIIILASADTFATLGRFYYVALSAAFGAGVVGLLDDMFRLRQRTKAVVPFVLALPLGAVVYASGDVYLLGWSIGLATVIAVPFGVTSAANAANMLEGYNGLGAGLMSIISVALIALSLLQGATEGLFILFPLLGALLAFLWYNRFPSRVFPGDSMTLFAGACIACAAIISSPPLKTQGAILFTPMIAEFVLKARSHFQAENYALPANDGRLRYEGRIESIIHLLLRRGRFREWELVGILWGIEAIVSAAVILAVGLKLW
jgi:UDP-N-acetylglucosamine--dolichyl-phosphate N-acetylglucosaminephosphotransferase